ncbi:hypothetical protein B0T11DRAFT_281934 [Plectosphaerella cucumerina]|uniref:Uncharacterized protein n=1 Tax=Plectosphaerella cucumerina TaxID=40658 RepID=A0A8K0X3T2_9PEZI|nr:hypothetical protein B0T11DRAFT_281934 [Plectosphaerella cucumerina]
MRPRRRQITLVTFMLSPETPPQRTIRRQPSIRRGHSIIVALPGSFGGAPPAKETRGHWPRRQRAQSRASRCRPDAAKFGDHGVVQTVSGGPAPCASAPGWVRCCAWRARAVRGNRPVGESVGSWPALFGCCPLQMATLSSGSCQTPSEVAGWDAAGVAALS